MNKVRIAHLFSDVANGGMSGADFDNGIWEHVLNVPRVPLELKMSDQQIALWLKNNNIDVLTCTMWGTFIAGSNKPERGVRTLKDEYPELKVVGIVDEPLMVDVCSRFGGNSYNMDISKGYANGLKDFDAILTICPHEVQFYKSFNPKTEYIGLPFPDKTYVNQIRREPRAEKKDQIWIGLGVGGNAFTRWERNYLVALEAFDLAVQKVGEFDRITSKKMKGILLSWTEKNSYDVVTFIKDNYPNVMLQMRSNMSDYLHFLQSCNCVVSPIVRDTPGRIVGECAFFGVPIFGSNIPSLQSQLYPNDWTLSPWDVEGYANQIVKCVIGGMTIEDEKDSKKYKMDNARRELIECYGMDVMAKKFRDAMNRFGICDEWYTKDNQEVLI